MILTRTPFRMSFFGGGTDNQEYFEEYGGSVISTTFDKYCYVTVRSLPGFFDYKTEVIYSKIERVTDINEIHHPAVRNVLKMLNIHDIRITYEADLPARSGLGTSSSFAVGLLNALHAHKGEYTDKRTLADEAIYLERVLCKESGGWQDQIAASFGGFNRIDFSADGYNVKPIIIPKEKREQLNNNLMLFFTGFTRFSSEIQNENAKKKDRNQYLHEIKKLTDEAEKVLSDRNSDMSEFGLLLDETWKLKKNTGKAVTTDMIDLIYENGKRAGALGGKLLGAGGGGFMVFYVEPEKKDSVKKAMHGLMQIPFQFENSGTSVLYYAPDK